MLQGPRHMLGAEHHPMPAYPMGKMDNCPGPRAQGGPELAERVIENVRKRGKEKEKIIRIRKNKMREKKQRNQEQEIVDSIGGHGGPAVG